ncbi:unnamed protein product [Rhizoctonia solani]|uniref:Protein kinase domain-containing protein n=1 Tax=Rhizoctonia solani TaxID=456999 RepID=A0A8H3HI24_9AGAM|nr:unnamed protein product [Rhizoctonia solani]
MSTADNRISWGNFVKDYEIKVSAWSRLDHPNLVRVYDLSQDINLCVEFCAHGSVRDYLKARVGQQANQVKIVGDVLQGLKYLHSKDIAHGSLNAGKIFVGADGQAKIGEFGLAALCYPVALWVPSITFEGFSRWMSPELLELEPEGNYTPTKESDMWALACVIWEIIYQKLPYAQYKHDIQIQEAILDDEHPGDFDTGVDLTYGSEFRGALELCWSKNPFQRPDTRAVLNDYLRAQSQSRDIPMRFIMEGLGPSLWPPAHPTNPQPSEESSVIEGLQDREDGEETTLPALSASPRPRTKVKAKVKAKAGRSKRLKRALQTWFQAADTEEEEVKETETKKPEYASPKLVKKEESGGPSTERPPTQSKDHMSPWISRLPSSPLAWYDSSAGAELKRRECTPGTRIDVLANLLSWASNNSTDAVYWLDGMAGTGKTTIAYSVCKQLADRGMLAASFFCSRLLQDCRDANLIIPSIAYQLARFSPPFQSALSAVTEKDQDAHHKVLFQQFETLIRRPLLAVHAAGPLVTEMVVVIDALDECENKESTRSILNLLRKAVDLPIKFIVSSRPELQIRDQMTDQRGIPRLKLHELDKGQVQEDIEKYLREGLAPMNPSDAQIAVLVERAGFLFIYAAAAVRFISHDNFRQDPGSRLCTFLDASRAQETTGHEEIDQMYATIVEAALGCPRLRPTDRDDMQQVLYTVICAREPLTFDCLSELLRIKNTKRIRAALQPLWSVLYIVEAFELVTTLHASFPNFMFDSARSKSYYCDSDTHHQELAYHCFELIKRAQSQFNICGLDSSYLLDEKVPALEDRVAEATPQQLLYACRFWADHVEAGRCAPGLVEPLQDFLSTRLLLWIEILNLNRQMEFGTGCMKTMVQWCEQFESHRELIELAHDAKRFVETFASNPVSQSTPHIYVSMLAFWPESTPIAKHYAKYTHRPVLAQGTALDRRQLAHLATWAFEEFIGAMAISPDGLYVALGIDSDVLVVDSSSGRVVLNPLKGHKNTIKSIAFSPDGTQVLAGSTHYDPYYVTILGWGARTGEVILDPLQLNGHPGETKCLSFSPDCAYIATGFSDGFVLLWNAKNGEMLHHLRTQDAIWDMAFSLDGTQIVVGFGISLQIWDTKTGKTILGPITTPIPVHRLSFSPDKNCVVCASVNSDYKPIYIVDTQSGDKTLKIMKGHTAGITCIGYSPDGRSIVSGCRDQTVHLWDVQNGNLVLGPLESHTGEITSVAFSHDGSRIISACKGGLVCTWDAQQRNLPPSSSHAPLDRITCVKFSSDGTQFVSGSEGGTISIWDAHTGEIKVGPIKAHTGRINAVDFLNDRVVLGSEDGKICVYDALSGKAVLGPLEVRPGGKVRAISYSPNGKYIATGSYNEINLWDAQIGSRVLGPFTGLQGLVMSIQFSRDGTRIVGSSDGPGKNIVVWDVPDGSNLFGTLDGHQRFVRSVSYSPDGTLIASGSNGKTIIIWDAYTGKIALGPLTGHSDWVHSVHFSPDSTHLVSGSFDRTIRIWDVQTGEMVFKLPNGHDDAILSVAYSPDGTRILSLSDDMSVRIHDARSFEERVGRVTFHFIWIALTLLDLIPQELSRSDSAVSNWTINKDGWVIDEQSRLLVWVPGDLRKALIGPNAPQVMIAPRGHVRLNLDESRMGESWARLFTPDS